MHGRKEGESTEDRKREWTEERKKEWTAESKMASNLCCVSGLAFQNIANSTQQQVRNQLNINASNLETPTRF